MTDFLLFIIVALILMLSQFAVIGGCVYWIARQNANLDQKLTIVSEHARVFERVEAMALEIQAAQKRSEQFAADAERVLTQMVHNYELRLRSAGPDDDGHNYTEV